MNEKAWSAEDFDHDEDDPTDRVLSSARKAPAKAKRKAKPEKAPGKSIECIGRVSTDSDAGPTIVVNDWDSGDDDNAFKQAF